MEPVCGQGGGRDPPGKRARSVRWGMGWVADVFPDPPMAGEARGAGRRVPGRAGAVTGRVIMRS